MKTSMATNMVKGIEVQVKAKKIVTVNSYFLTGKRWALREWLAPYSIYSPHGKLNTEHSSRDKGPHLYLELQNEAEVLNDIFLYNYC